MLTILALALTLTVPASFGQTAGPPADARAPEPGTAEQGTDIRGEVEQSAADRRVELRRFSISLERRLAAACRSAEPIVFMSGIPETRFVYLDGTGAIFLLPARSLPTPPTSSPDEPVPEVSVTSAHHGPPTGPQVRAVDTPSDLTDLEARIRETRKEAERMRAQADAAFADAERQLMAELRPGLSESTITASFPGGAWRLLLEDTIEDTRAPEQVEQDVRAAMVAAILDNAPLLRSLQPSDTVTASVDLVSRPRPWVRAKPARTLIVKALKSDLDAFGAGKLTRDDLLKRIETKAY